MKQLTAPLVAISLLLCTVRAATASEYDFELIIFEDTSGRYANSELWQHELAEAGSDAPAADKSDTAGADSNPTGTPIKGIGLGRHANALKSHKRYNVLVHKAWRQSDLDKQAGVDIPIDSRANRKAPGAAYSDSDGNYIHGNVRIVLARYLHIYTDLIYKQPRPDAELSWYEPETRQYREYPIKSHRRMRSKELHYLDHPMVGILIMAMPVKNEEPSEGDA